MEKCQKQSAYFFLEPSLVLGYTMVIELFLQFNHIIKSITSMAWFLEKKLMSLVLVKSAHLPF